MGFREWFHCVRVPKEKLVAEKTVKLRVRCDCKGCVRKVTHAVEGLKGVESFDVNQKQQMVTVSGHVDLEEVLEGVRNTGKTADPWPFVPYQLVTFPYVRGAYDIRAPSGFVRNVPDAMGDPKSPEMKMMKLFHDDNPHACSIM